MRYFFRSKKFKIILSVVLVLTLITVVFGAVTGWSAPQSNVVGAILSPIQRAAAWVSDSFDHMLGKMEDADKLQKENDRLQATISELTKQLVDAEDLKRQNEFYKQYLEIKDQNPSYQMQPAMVIARDNADPYASFTINKGVKDGISLYDPVITSEGLVGYIAEASTTQSVVMTLLNPDIKVSAADNRTRDNGTVSGDSALAVNRLCKLSYLPKNNAVAAGDYILSSGAGGIFPQGHIIGTVKEIRQDAGDLTAYAVVTPIVNYWEIKDVMVITQFDGQGSVLQ